MAAEIWVDVHSRTLGIWRFDVSYDSSVVALNYCSIEGQAECQMYPAEEKVTFLGVAIPGLNGSRLLGTVYFQASNPGQTTVAIDVVEAADYENGAPMSAAVEDGTVA